jgi:ribosomal protein S12 methylthiotransferase
VSETGAKKDRREAPVTRVGVISLGCAKNLVDTEVMLGHLDGAGHRLVSDPADADVIVVNTCGFIEAAREESIQTILEAAELKKTGHLRRLVVAGCMVQRYPEELRESLPEVDSFIGLDQLSEIIDSVPERDGAQAGGPLQIVSGTGSSYLYDETTPRMLATPPWTAYVKIAEGCDHTCSFCAIPSFRGRFRSRAPESVVREARELASRGVREINLIAQDSSDYGRDLGRADGLERLLEELDGLPGVRWIRVHYLYPNTITDRLIESMARLDRVVKYVDLPLQHAHPETLRRMRRGGTAAGHLRLLERFRSSIPDAAFRTTLIVGFPGETEAEFAALEEFVAEARFDHLGVFTYSHEKGTLAGDGEDDVPAEVKNERRERIMKLQQGIARTANERWVGRTLEVLVEGTHPETDRLLVGRLSTQAPDVDGQVLINDGSAGPGEFVPVELTEVAGYDLVGRIARAA